MGCSGVKSFELDQDNLDFVVKDGVLYDKTIYTVIYYPASLTAETFELPASVHELGVGSFAGAQLKTLVLPERITTIPEYAFCTAALESITLHKSLTQIGNYAFWNCPVLNNVVIPNSVKRAGNYAFAGCTALTSLTFEPLAEDGTTCALGEHFFDGCTALTQVIVPDGMTKLAPYMFANTGIVNAQVPIAITNISAEGVFYNCKNLETVNFVCKQLKTSKIGPKFFYGCSKIKELVIPDGVNNLLTGDEEFAYCTSLEKITFYTKILVESYAGSLIGCTSLKSIEIYFVGKYVKDENGVVIDYANTERTGIMTLYESVFKGSAVKQAKVGVYECYLHSLCLAGSNIETLVIDAAWVELYAPKTSAKKGTFSDAEALREVWFVGDMDDYVWFDEDAFNYLDHEVSFYFTTYTYDDLVDWIGDDTWYNSASKNAKFYFADEIPAGKQPPEGL